MSVECPECGNWVNIVQQIPARDNWSIDEDGERAEFLGTDPVGGPDDRDKQFLCHDCGTMLERGKDEDGYYFREQDDMSEECVECPECGENAVMQHKEIVEVRPVTAAAIDEDGKFFDVSTGEVFTHEQKHPGMVDEIIYQCTECGWWQ